MEFLGLSIYVCCALSEIVIACRKCAELGIFSAYAGLTHLGFLTLTKDSLPERDAQQLWGFDFKFLFTKVTRIIVVIFIVGVIAAEAEV